MAMAYAAGTEMCDLEFMQFHPTALALEGAPRFLLSEALRGEGAILRNHQGEAFAIRYDDRGELAPRDIVARAIVAEMERTGARSMFLDLTHLKADFLRERFPNIFETCLRYGLDLTKDQLPVSPAAHYLMGGVRTDTRGRTTLKSLYAAGEVACTGVHGANRLASNSLLEGLVFGARAGAAAIEDSFRRLQKGLVMTPQLRQRIEMLQMTKLELSELVSLHHSESAPVEFELSEWRLDPRIKNRVQEIMWRKVGLIRRADDLRSAIEELTAMAGENVNERTRNFVTLARLMAEAALWREESRGGHFREDFPARDNDRWRVHSAQRNDHPISPIERVSE
jgi:L-aspartate oxidase